MISFFKTIIEQYGQKNHLWCDIFQTLLSVSYMYGFIYKTTLTRLLINTICTLALRH